MLNELGRDILFVILIIAGAIHICYYLFIFSRLAFYKAAEKESRQLPVSVIVCAKNEANNLRKYLNSILEQSYPDYEVIVVNDCSWDETGEYLKEQLKMHSRLKVVTIREQDRYKHGKKFALTLGIKAAKNEILLMTDADCMVAGKNWISSMQSRYNQNTEIVLGYGAYRKEKGFLNMLIRFDTFQIAFQYLSFALSGIPYMGVGRNLSYLKSTFFRSKGFASHNHIFSGDDDLFVNENATSANTAIEISPESFTFSDAKKTFVDWHRQKSRHGTTSRYYKKRHQTLLALLSISNLVFLAVLITLLVNRYKIEIILSIYVAKLLLQWAMNFMTANKLGEKSLMWYYPLLEIMQTILQPIFYLSSLFTKQRAWK
jgi:glycosyltransferase involved in cell wall biosynthesis